MNATFWFVVAGALVTYATRVGGYLVISRFGELHPRVAAALDAVPAAVLVTLVAPALLDASVPEMLALLAAGLVALRFGLMTMFLVGAAVLVGLRQFL